MSAKKATAHPYLDQLKEDADVAQLPVLSKEVGDSRDFIDERIVEENIRHERIENDIREKDQELKERTLKWLFILLGVETGIVFGVATLQGFRTLGFYLDEWSLRLLLAATLVQTVSMLTIAIRHLFPQK